MTENKKEKYEEINELRIEAKTGDEYAKEKIINKLDPLIRKKIKGYSKIYKKIDYEDFYQEASIAILEAIEEFDVDKKVHFLGFVKCKIEYHLLNLNLKNKDNEKISSLNYVENETDVEEIELIVDETCNIESLVEVDEKMQILKEAIKTLTDRQKNIFVEYYIKDRKLKTIAEELNISYRTAVNTKVHGMDKIKKYFKQRKFIDKNEEIKKEEDKIE